MAIAFRAGSLVVVCLWQFDASDFALKQTRSSRDERNTCAAIHALFGGAG
jgi:hypothetical protein